MGRILSAVSSLRPPDYAPSMPVGVVVPVGGFAPYLAEALDSVLAERPAAVVVCDDAADPPVALHPDHAARVTVVRRDERGGPSAARGRAFSALPADADLIALCDADDAWTPGSLARRVAALEQDPGAAMVFGRAVVVGPGDEPTGERWAEPAGGVHPAAGFAAELLEANPVPTSSVVLRRAALEACGGFASDLPLAEDWDLWLRLARAGWDAVCVPEVVCRYRRHPWAMTADVPRLAAAERALRQRFGAPMKPDAGRAARRGRRDPYRRHAGR
jgi:cellulose synthase/poly-beta-1,6-N-acetylglucosamine synthase-like glycosyltransferase